MLSLEDAMKWLFNLQFLLGLAMQVINHILDREID